jgi:hypothetical protein
MAHIPSLIGTAILFGLCYLLAYVTLSGTQMFIAIVSLVIVYAATVIWYLRKTL